MLDGEAMDEREVIRDAVASTELSDLELRAVPVLESGAIGFCWQVPVREAHALWRQVRPHAEALGRWPLLVLEAFYPDTFSRAGYAREGDQSPDAILRRAEQMTLEQVWEVYPLDAPFPWDDETWDRIARSYLNESAARIGLKPALTLEDSRRMRPDFNRFERALFDWEEQQRQTTAMEDGAHLNRQPWFDTPCGLMLMPCSEPWEVPAYTDFFGASGPRGHEALVRAMRSWHERFGAEVMASFGTELQFDVRRPPTDVQAAYRLAREQIAVAPYTTAGPCVSARQHARALLGRTDWYLHERP